MKLFKSRKLSILLALTLVLTSFSFTAMADTTVADDVSIISTEKNLKDITNIKKDLPEDYLMVTDKNFVDPLTGKTVVKYSAKKYGAPQGSNWEIAGGEPRSALNGLLAKVEDYSNDKFTNLTIAFDIYIEHATDGLAFRLERYSTETNTLITTNGYNYVGVGGSEFAAGSANYTYINKDLKVREWNKVVIELGANTTNRDVIFHVNGKSTVCARKLPENTYGFGGKNENHAVLIPKGNQEDPFEIRLNNFSIVATNKVRDFNIHNSDYFTAESFVGRTEPRATYKEENALDFSEDYNKKAGRIENARISTKNALSGEVGKEVGFQLYPGATASTKASLGGVDWSKYKNLRIQFNAYLDYENIIYFRTVRIKDGVIEQEGNNHVIGVGTPANPEVTGNNETANTGGSDHVYKYRRMAPNEWHNVVMELGANKANKYINIYIDGVKVKSASELPTEFEEGDAAEGFAAVGTNRCLLVFRDTADSFFNGQISDISFTACNSMYTPDAAPSIDGVVRAKDSTGGLSYRVDTGSKIITYVEGRDEKMTLEDFKSSNVDYFAPTDANNTKVIAYNDTSKRVTYYTIAEQTGVVLDGIQAEIGADGRLYVQYDYTNPNNDKDLKFKLFIACFKDEALVYIGGDVWYEHPYGLSAVSHDFTLPTRTEYDTIKVFAWGSTGGENSVTIIPILKMAEVVK